MQIFLRGKIEDIKKRESRFLVLFIALHRNSALCCWWWWNRSVSLWKCVFCRDVSRFDLVANGGASLTLRYERTPFPTLQRTVWLPWNVFHVMDTVVMKREENDIPSCYLTGLIRPNPQILATPLSTFYKSSPEDSPIVPETQVRIPLPTPQLLIFYFNFCFNLISASFR